MGSAVVTSLEQRRSRRQLPPRPGGHPRKPSGAAAPAMARFPRPRTGDLQAGLKEVVALQG
jgi:hypothetical protein